MDALEKFIAQYREAFYEDQPPQKVWEAVNERLEEEAMAGLWTADEVPQMPQPEVWERIEAQLDAEQKPSKRVKMVPVRHMWQMAAVFAVILVSALWMQSYWKQLVQAPEVAALALPEELQAAEQYYTQEINARQVALSNYEWSSYGLSPEQFQQELTTLDSAYAQMKLALLESQGSERVVSAMVQNLQLRMAILSRQLDMLQQLQAMDEDQIKGVEVAPINI